MNKKQLAAFFKYLTKNNQVLAPVLDVKSGRVLIQEAADFLDVEVAGRLPEYSWREFLLPQQEKLFQITKNKLQDDPKNIESQVLFGVGLPDLHAITLYDLVFEKDSYYQERKRKTLVVGYVPLGVTEDYAKWQAQYEENILEHVKFDIFLEIAKNGSIKVFSGSEEGQKVLEQAGVRDYQHIDYAGPVTEGKLNQHMLDNQAAMQSPYNKKVWQELGERCLACGKCSLVCPTCFCFCKHDEIGLEKGEGKRKRCWDTCFYNSFSEVAGGHKFQETNEKRIYFWYEHKFVRIPVQFQVAGCVGCGRCIRTCPVSINIFETEKALLKGKKKITPSRKASADKEKK